MSTPGMGMKTSSLYHNLMYSIFGRWWGVKQWGCAIQRRLRIEPCQTTISSKTKDSDYLISHDKWTDWGQLVYAGRNDEGGGKSISVEFSHHSVGEISSILSPVKGSVWEIQYIQACVQHTRQTTAKENCLIRFRLLNARAIIRVMLMIRCRCLWWMRARVVTITVWMHKKTLSFK